MKNRRASNGILLATPVLAGTLIFFFLPLCIALWYSMTFGVGGTDFVGLSNYATILQSGTFRLAVWNTVRFIIVCVPLVMCLSLLLALPMQHGFFGAAFFRSASLVPMVLPAASIVMVINIFCGNQGILPTLLQRFSFPIENLLQTPIAFLILTLLYLWKNLGLCLVLFLAGLNSIPRNIYDAALMDGASSQQIFLKITLPLLRPFLLFAGIFSVINCFRVYREAFLLGGPHPDQSIYMLQHFLNNNFQNLNYQRLSVAAILMLVFLAVLFTAGYNLWRKDEA